MNRLPSADDLLSLSASIAIECRQELSRLQAEASLVERQVQASRESVRTSLGLLNKVDGRVFRHEIQRGPVAVPHR